MIIPTVGRVVWIFEGGTTAPLAGLIACVQSERVINVAYFDVNGNPKSATSVPLAQDESQIPAAGIYATWMPYQKGQAAKTEALEKQAAGA